MKYQTILLRFMAEKNTIVRKHTRMLVATKPDMDEIRTWPESMCKKALVALHSAWDNRMCPWCILSENCDECTYAKRHEQCTEGALVNSTSRYGKIYHRLGNSGICSLAGMRELVDKYKWILARKLAKEIRSAYKLKLGSAGGN